MKLTRENLDALFTTFNAALAKGLEKEWRGYERWSVVVNSRGASETYPLALVTGGLREWIGPRVINKLDTGKLTVRNRDFEDLESVSRNDIEDDAVGMYAPVFEAMGAEAASLWGRLATEAICNPGNWADGAAFFSSRKLSRNSTVNNAMAGESLTLANYETARARMMGFTAANGAPMGLVPDLLMVGPSLEPTAKGILDAQLVSDGSAAVSNVHYKEAEVQVNPYMTGAYANMWFLMCTTRGTKPVAVQKRKLGALVRYDQEHDSCVKDANENHYSIHCRGNGAAIQPALVIGGNV